MHLGHDVVTVDVRSTAPAGARSAMCSTARSSVTLICSPANIASRRGLDAGVAGQLQQSLEDRVVDRCFE